MIYGNKSVNIPPRVHVSFGSAGWGKSQNSCLLIKYCVYNILKLQHFFPFLDPSQLKTGYFPISYKKSPTTKE